MKVMREPRISKDQYYLDIAKSVCKRSTCLKRRYGCVIVNNDVIISTGYNGSPRGAENCCDRGTCMREDAERYTGYENCCGVHAEQNAIMQADYDKLKGATIYLYCEEYKATNFNEHGHFFIDNWIEDGTPIPCGICMKMLKNAGVKRIVTRGTI